MKLIIGLGNPGKDYENTRHNIGFKVLDAVASKLGVEISSKKHNSLIYKAKDFILAKPQTYMNLSGDAVQKIASYYNIATDDILVIYDEVNLSSGHVKMKPQGSDGGQKGIADIIQKIGTSKIARLKVGIGKNNSPLKNYVLGKFTKLQIEQLDKIKENLIEAVYDFIYSDLNTAMNKVNSIIY